MLTFILLHLLLIYYDPSADFPASSLATFTYARKHWNVSLSMTTFSPLLYLPSETMSHKTKGNGHEIPCYHMGEPWMKPITKDLMFMIPFIEVSRRGKFTGTETEI